MRVDWTATARREFNQAFDYMFNERPAAALAWQEDVRSMLEMIELHPEMGHRHRSTPGGEYREMIVGRYRFIYRLAGNILKMRRILHVRRDFDPQRIREGVPRGFPVFASAA
ncbi:MAG TPA: type II toxin-antitoxin system RelE/ParE family toxin [Thermoanaerobaculia bacterium]|nr:type II toxin-antitoxin system RelE/ParE family toxin [Thermoanaerobaculia bacterium]